MMSSDLSSAENGGSQQTQNNWWLARWSSKIACAAAVLIFFCGAVVAATSAITINLTCLSAGLLQILTACLVLSIEGSSIVSFLTFTKPISDFFEGKPVWLKTAIYAVLTVISPIVGYGFFWFLGFLFSLGITAMYGMLLIGRKGELGNMKQFATQPSST